MLKVLTVLDPILHQKARDVTENEFGKELVAFLQEMAVTMYAENGVGLAAPQVGDSRRILVMDPKQGIVTYMVNPIILDNSELTECTEEGCLSVPGTGIQVTRPETVTVSWRNGEGHSFTQTFTGFPAVVVQHEMDHLDGVTLVQRMSNFKRKRYLKKLRKAVK